MENIRNIDAINEIYDKKKKKEEKEKTLKKDFKDDDESKNSQVKDQQLLEDDLRFLSTEDFTRQGKRFAEYAL